MATISVCMIVKNEEKTLKSCLTSLKAIADEIIIVDTGSIDNTKNIAEEFTDKIFDFEWVGDFAKARNFAFSKATKDYIYSADADEFIDEENQQKFLELKAALMPEVEIVQMLYNEEEISTVLNSTEELRPKLYKRNRSFVWIDPVHETVRTLPVVFDSDIVIEHRPQNLHAPRDFSLIEKAYENDGNLSKKLYEMYAREVYKWGERKDLKKAADIFDKVIDSEMLSEELFSILSVVCARSARLEGDISAFIKHSSKVLANSFCSEICCELGDYFESVGDGKEASLWFYNAINEAESILDIDSKDKYPMEKLK